METKNNEPKNICHSCSMPLEKPGLVGTEKDGSASKEYCVYCYRDGSFINPGMTLPEMTKFVREQMLKQKIDTRIISLAIETLPHLKRWNPRYDGLITHHNGKVKSRNSLLSFLY